VQLPPESDDAREIEAYFSGLDTARLKRFAVEPVHR
jgi:hypothetical protein